MILSEHERRWYEVKLYHTIIDIYEIRDKMIDVVDVIEAICALGNAKTGTLKRVVNNIVDSPYYRPFKREIVLLAHLQGYGAQAIADYTHMTRQAVYKIINKEMESYVPLPRFSVDEDYEIKKFLDTLDKLKKVGL